MCRIDKAKLYERLLATFIDELGTHVRSMNEDLLALEKIEPGGETRDLYARLFRAAHSLKGASRAVELPAIEQLSHRLEDVFTKMRDGSLSENPELFSLLFDAADVIEAAGMQLREKSPLDTAPLEDLKAKLESATGQDAGNHIGDAATPSQPEHTQDDQESEKPHEKEDLVEKRPADSGERCEEPSKPANPPTPKAAAGENTTPLKPKSIGRTVRVAEEKLDSLLAQVGELLVARQRVERSPASLESLLEAMTSFRKSLTSNRAVTDAGDERESLQKLEKAFEHTCREIVADVRQLRHISIALQDDVFRIRMVPFVEACSGLERTVRDLAASTGKSVQLQVTGGDVEMDRAVVEGLRDPLMHLVRNAIDHGVESAGERKKSGKPPGSTIQISAELQGSEVAIVVSDDGQGVDLEKIRQKLRDKGLAEPSDERTLIRQIFLPGFSTAKMITDVSGRGVGMDVVLSQLESLRGTVDVFTTKGQGTRFVMSVPLTLTTIPAILVRSGRQTYAISSGQIQKLIRFPQDNLLPSQGGWVLEHERRPLPVFRLSDVLGQKQTPQPADAPLLGIVVRAGGSEAIVVVDEILSEQEIVLKNLGHRVRRTRFVSGASLLASGEIALLLNLQNLLASAGEKEYAQRWTQRKEEAEHPSNRLLLVDDSLTTRSLLKNILEDAGYAVTVAVDGQDAWEKLSRDAFELIVSDVDMPRMNGFQLTRRIRDTETTKMLPVVLVTARDTEDDKIQGVRSGADAYLVKSTFQQTNLLETISQLL